MAYISQFHIIFVSSYYVDAKIMKLFYEVQMSELTKRILEHPEKYEVYFDTLEWYSRLKRDDYDTILDFLFAVYDQTYNKLLSDVKEARQTKRIDNTNVVDHDVALFEEALSDWIFYNRKT